VGGRGGKGMMVTASALTVVHREQIVALAKQHKLPTIYPVPDFIASGGLITYGADISIHIRHPAGYVDRILRGEKPADPPVQAPTKNELVINLKSANALSLENTPTCSPAPTRGSNEKAPQCHVATGRRRGGGVADCGERAAAGRTHAADRRANRPRRGRSGSESVGRRIPARTCKARMVKGPQSSHRLSLSASRRSST